MPEKEYIEREAIAKHIDQSFGEVSTPFVVREIRNFPTADVAEVKHGEWKPVTGGLYGWKCNLCDEHIYVNRKSNVNRYLYPYCPNCGAKMDGKEKGNAVHR